MSTLAIVVSLLLAVFSYFKMRSNDPYGLFHLALNRLPDDDPNEPPKTEWLNMGYWREAKTFPEACTGVFLSAGNDDDLKRAALALKMMAGAGLKEKGTVLDVGHGTGESLLFLLSERSLPRPSRLVGITSLPAHHLRSLERVHKFQSASGSTAAVDLHAGDAIYTPASPPSHPLSPSSPTTFDSILALDCAYHFHTRHAFLRQSFEKLTSGGHIALADICFSPSQSIFYTLTLRMAPRENMISPEEYVAQMQDIGYVDVELEDVSSDVFPGFVRFLKGRGWGWWVFGWVLERWWRAGATFVVVSGRKPNIGAI